MPAIRGLYETGQKAVDAFDQWLRVYLRECLSVFIGSHHGLSGFIGSHHGLSDSNPHKNNLLMVERRFDF